MTGLDLDVAYQPRLPTEYRPGIGIVGFGGIVKSSHLPAYRKHELDVIGVYDVSPDATQDAEARYGVGRVYPRLDDLLADPAVEVVDVATHPAERIGIVRKALAAGKHVLAQKPLALDVRSAREAADEAVRRGLKLGVNQNGRWAPPWRVATLLIEQGVIGEVRSVTHLHEINFGWNVGTKFDAVPHMAIYDYSIHWIDITRCWLAEKPTKAVRAREYRTPGQPSESQAAWGMWVEVEYGDGSNGLIRNVGCAREGAGHPFWIHGSEGTIRGSVLGNDYVELDKDGVTHRWRLEGQWFPDGFAGAMGELLCAIKEEREPYNSALHNLLSLGLTLAACRSAEQESRPIPLEEVMG